MNARAPFACAADIEAIARGLRDRSWPAKLWTHDCHWAAALWLIDRHGLTWAQSNMPTMIRAYNLAAGGQNTDTAGYHETITQASLLAAAGMLADAPPGTPLHLTCNRLMSGPLGRPGWVETYWSPDLLFSLAARHAWVAPDRGPLPFDTPALQSY